MYGDEIYLCNKAVVDSKWGRFKNWLNSDWGQEEYTVKVQEYKVDMNKIKTQVRKDLEDSQKLLNQSIQKILSCL